MNNKKFFYTAKMLCKENAFYWKISSLSLRKCFFVHKSFARVHFIGGVLPLREGLFGHYGSLLIGGFGDDWDDLNGCVVKEIFLFQLFFRCLVVVGYEVYNAQDFVIASLVVLCCELVFGNKLPFANMLNNRISFTTAKVIWKINCNC